MEEYLGSEYTKNSIENFIKYWIKSYNKPRSNNDLDCLYFEGDLNADTLFSVWTSLKFVLDSLNPNERFYKVNKYGDYPHKFLKG
jgi:hypothetical protein